MGGSWQQQLPVIAGVVFLVWVGVSLSTPATTGDLWTNFKVGEEILSGAGFPSVERYSATAEGRPFVAYEWLSAVVFTAIYQSFGSGGLVVLRVVIGLACIALLAFALTPAVREKMTSLPLLIVATYLLCFRTHVRPHLFSLLLISVLCFALERWRRSRRPGEIVWLIPLHAVWANLHGAYLFGVVLMGAVAGLVGLLALFPRLGAVDEPAYGRREFLQLAGVAAGCLAASLVNPYGTAALELSFRMSEASEFIKTFVWEWRSPFATGPGKVWFALYCSFLALLWASVLLRLRERRWIDLLIASLVTYQSVRANRFVPYLAVFAFPIVARCAAELSSHRWRSKEERLRPWVSLGLIAFMLATVVGPWSEYSPRSHRVLGAGFGTRLPFEEVEYLRDEGLEGVIYNEYDDGALIIHALHPQVRPVMDARIDVYGRELYQEWHSSRETVERFFAYLDKYDVQLALLLRTWRPNREMAEALRSDPGWRLLQTFPKRFLYGRVGAGGRRLAEPAEGAPRHHGQQQHEDGSAAQAEAEGQRP